MRVTLTLSPQVSGRRYSAWLFEIGTTTPCLLKNDFNSMPAAASDSS